MSEMGLGYGSEYQLLRFLGHHRNELEGEILRNTRLNPECDLFMEWEDFPKDSGRASLDGEHKGISFLSDNEKVKLSKAWQDYWPQGNPPNWDGIIYSHPMNGVEKWILVEAKAHLWELKAPGAAKDPKSIKMIDAAFKNTQNNFGINPPNDWRVKNDYYQLANRLAVVNFLLEHKIEARLLYIYFLNGYEKKIPKTKIVIVNKSVQTKGIWEKAIADEYKYLGIDKPVYPISKYKVKHYISEIFLDCNLQLVRRVPNAIH